MTEKDVRRWLPSDDKATDGDHCDPYSGVSNQNSGKITCKWMVKIMENPIKMIQIDEFGGETYYFWKHPYRGARFLGFFIDKICQRTKFSRPIFTKIWIASGKPGEMCLFFCEGLNMFSFPGFLSWSENKAV